MSVPMILRRLYASDHLIKEKDRKGELPSTKSAYSNFFKFAWPSMAESLLISLVGLVDTQMVSGLGSSAVTAVGVTNQPKFLFYAPLFALNVGVTAIVSRRKGQNDREGANRCLAQSLLLVVVLGALLCGTAIVVAEPLIRFAGGSDAVIDEAVTYYRIIMVGMFFTALGLVINGSHRGTGKTQISMIANVTANLINCLFNYLLINGHLFFPALGVKGAAIATLIGNIVSCLISVYTVFFRKNSYLRIKFREIFRLDTKLLALIGNVASGAAVEQVFLRFGFFAYSILVNNLGDAAIATHTACMTIVTISFAVGDGLGIASSALVGQNLGKKRPDLSKLYGKVGQRLGVIVSVILVLLFTIGAKFLVSIFVVEGDPNAEYMLSVGVILLYILAATSPAQISQVVYNGCLRGAGDTKFVALTSLITIALVRPLTTYLLCYPLGLGLIGAWISLLIDQYLRLAFSSIRFIGGKWSKIII